MEPPSRPFEPVDRRRQKYSDLYEKSWLSKEGDETHRKKRGKRIKAEMYDQKEGGGG